MERQSVESADGLASVPEHMAPLLDYFAANMVREIAQIFDSPEDYWEAMSSYTARGINSGQYDSRIDVLSELRQQRRETSSS